MLAFLRSEQRTPLRLRLAVMAILVALAIPVSFVTPEEK